MDLAVLAQYVLQERCMTPSLPVSAELLRPPFPCFQDFCSALNCWEFSEAGIGDLLAGNWIFSAALKVDFASVFLLPIYSLSPKIAGFVLPNWLLTFKLTCLLPACLEHASFYTVWPNEILYLFVLSIGQFCFTKKILLPSISIFLHNVCRSPAMQT